MGRKPNQGLAEQTEYRTIEGLAIRALYDGVSVLERAGGRLQETGWKIVSSVPAIAPAQAALVAREELAGGAHGLLLPAAEAGWSVSELVHVLAGVSLDGIVLHLDAGAESNDSALSLLALARTQGISAHGWCLGLDPLRVSAQDCASALQTAQALEARAVLADSTPFHEAGAHAVTELALLLGATAHALRVLEGAAIPPEQSLASLAWRMPMERDFFGGMVKLRAARTLWASFAAACGMKATPVPLLHAFQSSRNLTRRAPHTNLLRSTLQVSAAAIGGADAVSALPFDSATGVGSEIGRRLARNVALVVEHEARLLEVADPAGGSAHVEERTHEMASAAWEEFRSIERGGGLAAWLGDGRLRTRLAAEWETRRARLAYGEEILLGVNLHAEVGTETESQEPSAGPWHLPRHREEAACMEGGG